MTSWHAAKSGPEAYAESSYLNLGSESSVLLVFVGEPPAFEAFLFEVRRRLTSGCS